MCLAYPARIGRLVDATVAEVTVRDRCRPVVLLTLDAGPPPRPGDWLLVHSGLAIQRLTPDEAYERRRLIGAVLGDDES
jgi:hydrogenase assembly chaperone HypC/HupF